MLQLAKRQKESTGFGTRLRTLREAAGLTQTELGTRSGLLYQTIAKYERSKIEPNWVNVLKLADALSVSVDAFRAPDQPDDDLDPPARPSGKRK